MDNSLKTNYLAVFVASIAAFIESPVWYIIFSDQATKLSPAMAAMTSPPPANLVIEFIRSLIVAYVLSYLILRLGLNWLGAIRLGFLLWLAFPAVLLTGSVIWENVPWLLAVIHSGDWLVKILLISFIVTVWRKKKS
jgi:hypothetical protein